MKSVWKAVVLILFDQITKWILFPRNFFVSFLRIHGVKNYGLPFGINLNHTLSLFLIMIVLLGFLFYYFKSKTTSAANLGFIFIFAGALSNIIDRIAFGFVRDFLDFGLSFTANFADAIIVVGLIILMFNLKDLEN